MLGLLYLTSVASLIAISAVLHQLSTSAITSTSRIAHLPSPAPVHVHVPLSASPTGHPNCCVPDTESQDHRYPSASSSPSPPPPPFPVLSDTRPSTSTLSPDVVLCFWDSLLSSLALSDPPLPPQPDASLHHPSSSSSLLCVGCADLRRPLQCGAAQNASLPVRCGRRHPSALLGPWLPLPALLSGSPLTHHHHHQSELDPLLGHGCCPHTLLPFGKVPALLVPS